MPDVPKFRESMALFYDAMTNVDKQVGEILDKLEEQGLSEDTILVFRGGTPEREFWETSVLPGDQKLHDPDGVFLMLGPPVMVNQHGLPEACKQVLFWQDHKPLEELYDIENDPEEINNLADDPSTSVCLAAATYFVRMGEGAQAIEAFARASGTGNSFTPRVYPICYLTQSTSTSVRHQEGWAKEIGNQVPGVEH